MVERKYRRCPSCGAVLAASEFPRVTARALAGGFGEQRRVRCPACGHEDLRSSFAEVGPPEEGEVTKGPVP
jgi:ribosomal protein S27AE